jgi:hypothetical protein
MHTAREWREGGPRARACAVLQRGRGRCQRGPSCPRAPSPPGHWALGTGGRVRTYVGVDIELARLVMARLVIARYCNEPARLGSLY